jgi:hypothetical protein
MQQMNAIAPGGIASMMRGMPQGQPQKPLSPTAGIGNVADRIKAYGPQGLEQKNAVSEDLLNLIAAQKLKSEKEAALRDMQMKAAQQGQPLTVAQSLDKELMQMTKQEMAPQQMAPQVAGASQQQAQQQQAAMQKLMQGIARAPGAQQMPGMAGGGIVAFQNRGEVPQDATLKAYNETKRQLVAATKSGDPQSVQFYLKRLQELRNQIEPGLLQQAERETSKAEAPGRVASMLEGPAPEAQAAPQLPAPSLGAAQENSLEALMRGKTGDPSIDIGPRVPPAQVTSKVPVAPGAGITQALDKPVMAPGAAGQGISPAMGPQMPDLEAARRMEEERRRKATELPPDLAAYQKEQLERLRQATQPKDKRWYERLGDFAPYLAAQPISPSRPGIAGALSRMGVAGAQLGAAERAQQEKAQSAYDAARAAQMKEYQAGKLGEYEAGLGAEKAAREAAFKKQELGISQAGVDATLAGIAQRARTGSEDIQARAREAAADRENRVKVAEIQAAARNDPQSKEAMAVARVQQAINGSQLLKQLAERARFDPEAAAEYRREEQRLYLMLAPDLMINRAPTGGASSTRSAADKIISGG